VSFFEAVNVHTVGLSSFSLLCESGHTVVLGASDALVEACLGSPSLEGSVRLFGRTPKEAMQKGLVTCVAATDLDSIAIPVGTLVAEAAAFADRSPLDAARALAAFSLESVARKQVRSLPLHQRYACLFAHALATTPQGFLFRDPFPSKLAMDSEALAHLSKLFFEAFAPFAWIALAESSQGVHGWPEDVQQVECPR
jgi:hypothetical protein